MIAETELKIEISQNDLKKQQEHFKKEKELFEKAKFSSRIILEDLKFVFENTKDSDKKEKILEKILQILKDQNQTNN